MPDPSTNNPAASTALNDTPVTDTLDGMNISPDKYIVINTFYLNFSTFVAPFFWGGAQNYVAGFLLDPHFAPIGTFENFNIPI